MTEPTRLRVEPRPQGVLVRALLSHPMETGRRHDAEGRAIPAWHIAQVSVALNGRVVMTAQWGTGIAKNPFAEFVVRGAKPGDTVAIAWLDNRGERRSDQVTVA
jgi:sulfur-oxidizing protein SoxZ